MLIITGKEQERIFIGDDITITITQTGGSQVRLGIDAPNRRAYS